MLRIFTSEKSTASARFEPENLGARGQMLTVNSLSFNILCFLFNPSLELRCFPLQFVLEHLQLMFFPKNKYKPSSIIVKTGVR